MEIANKYFGKENRTVATLVEKKPEGVRPLIEIAKEIYEEKSGEKPTEEVVEALSQMIDKFDEAEKMYGRTFSRNERIEMIKQSIEMILKQK
jgi:anti-sigma28 factor (negative regulator of flagellin synthesis)